MLRLDRDATWDILTFPTLHCYLSQWSYWGWRRRCALQDWMPHPHIPPTVYIDTRMHWLQSHRWWCQMYWFVNINAFRVQRDVIKSQVDISVILQRLEEHLMLFGGPIWGVSCHAKVLSWSHVRVQDQAAICQAASFNLSVKNRLSNLTKEQDGWDW